jgi:hypothetical protein
MPMKPFFYSSLIILVLNTSSCKQEPKESSPTYFLEDTIMEDTSSINENIRSTKSLVYNMYLPCEMVYLFNKASLNYNPMLINPIKNKENYHTAIRKAVNLGIYGVDMGYLKMNNQTQDIKDYSVVITNLAKELDIPEDKIHSGLKYIDNYNISGDSLYQITCRLFNVTDNYLNKDDREAIATMIVLGGWVEAIYLSMNSVEADKKEAMMEEIGRQKYSLNSLITLLKMHQENYTIMNYLVMLKTLKEVYNDITLYYDKGEKNLIDTAKKVISTQNAEVRINSRDYDKIKRIIDNLRKQIVG